MGLDWHSVIKMTEEDKIDWVNENCVEDLDKGISYEELMEEAPEYQGPCGVVGAKKMRERETFEKDISEYVQKRKKDAREVAEREDSNTGYVEYWMGRTVEEEMLACADKWDCDNCPLLKDLQGADSTGSFFIGITVSSCDFRGKMISIDDAISGSLRDEAYEEKGPREMLEYADALEEEIEFLREEGLLEKQSYEDYSKKYDESTWPFKDPKQTPEEYAKTFHWRESNLRHAIHWLRTCAKYGIQMIVSY